MKKDDLVVWFKEIADATVDPVVTSQGFHENAVKWMSEARSAIAAAFPPWHPIHGEWEAALLVGDKQKIVFRGNEAIWSAVRGVFASAHSQLSSGRLDSFVDIIRADAEGELLDQAEFLNAQFRVAAAVLAGGALEVHLRRLCEKNRLSIQGHGSIDKYNTAVAQARNSGTTIYEKADQSLVTSWGQIRNEAAHHPDQFQRIADEIRLMIEGIRSFIARIR